MDPSEASLARERCELHPDRAAVGRCERCGRTTCLDCAIPFRGAIRCERCAAIELGEPAPAAEETPKRSRAEILALGLLLATGLATLPPWHRSGTLTTPLSAWSFGLDGWAALACASLAGAAVLFLASLIPRSSGLRAAAAATALSAVSAGSVGVTMARAPEFFSVTPAPFLVLTGAFLATLLGAFRLLRRERP